MPDTATNSTTPASGDSLFREPTSFANILYNARSLRSFLRTQSDVHEEQRRLSPEVVAQLKAAGVYRMCVSKRRGGPELTSMEQVEVIEELARGDASTAWVTMIGCDSGLFAGFMDDAAADELYPNLDMSQAAWVRAAGQAHEIDGGYRVSGYWMFGSGCSHADVIGAGAVVFRDGKPVLNDDGSPYWKMFVAPASYWEVKTDTWHTTGLRGTGSHDYTTRGKHVIVPAEHSFTLFEPKDKGTLWAKPDALLRKMVGIPLGLARQTIEDVKDRLGGKVGLSGAPYRDLTPDPRRDRRGRDEARPRAGLCDVGARAAVDPDRDHRRGRRADPRDGLAVADQRRSRWSWRSHSCSTTPSVAPPSTAARAASTGLCATP